MRTASATAVSVTTRAPLAMLLFGSHTTDSYRAGVLAPVAISATRPLIDLLKAAGHVVTTSPINPANGSGFTLEGLVRAGLQDGH